MSPEERNARASRLRDLLENSDAKDAIASIDDEITAAWRNCPDPHERDNLWRAQHLLGLLTRRLATWSNADLTALRRVK
jgi:uncharacterized protein (DUF2267 family)